MATPYRETKDGFESQMAINYLGHFLLTHLLMPQLIKGSESNDGKNVRIVNVSSCVHRVIDMNYKDFHCKYEFIKIQRTFQVYSRFCFASRKYYYPGDAYGKSKLAQVFFTKHLDTLLKKKGLNIQVHSTHPGIVNTDLFEHSSNTYIPWFKDIFYKVNQINISLK